MNSIKTVMRYIKTGAPVNLTQLEFELLLTFFRTIKSQVLTRDNLIQQVWGYDFAGDEKISKYTYYEFATKIRYRMYSYNTRGEI